LGGGEIETRWIKWVEHVTWVRELKLIVQNIYWKSERKRYLRIPRGRWEDNIKVDIKETE
jgi:hypothetical protein